MKQKLKRLIRQLADKPVIGRFVRIGVALLRFPRHFRFLVRQLPSLLQTVSEIKHKQTRQDQDRESFDKTAPQTLRRLTRDIAELRRTVDALQRVARAPLTQPSAANSPLHGIAVHLDETEGAQARVILEYCPLGQATTVSALEAFSLSNGTVKHVSISHALEHVSHGLLKTSLLPYLFDLMAPGGQVAAEFTDADAVLQGYANGALDADGLRDSIFGQAEFSAEPRRNLLDAPTLAQLLQQVGFVQVEILPIDAKAPYRRTVLARKEGEA